MVLNARLQFECIGLLLDLQQKMLVEAKTRVCHGSLKSEIYCSVDYK
jgi:hypothetical protein